MAATLRLNAIVHVYVKGYVARICEGCDECESWWHYWCAGLDKMLSEEEEWLCDFCQRHDC